ncbi:cysteine--tRNA ligase [Amnibacterium setariae]|uniref:Cysteine--tRNA ligase n=1 Tax=Amnibacterium setariae TaxID=2306585 RepID=A0A3A1U2F8_9MICO|nr:cysteine--tRNA ligase [Amnibacterium setariae]RIX30500.1 cysteine--tRNA ligase [Amnibacterium setariae]
MTVRLYDTRSQALRELDPVVPGRVGIYVCGPTVQSSPHIGHLRSALSYDVMRRWLAHSGLAVTLIRNVTDIDDKILDAAPKAGSEWWAHAYRVELEFAAAYRALGIQEPTYEPRATGHIGEMIALIGRLVEAGHAYPAEDGSGDVWFDVASWPDYGVLTRQTGDDFVAGDGEGRAKRSPRDFALWKGRKAEEPESASWPSPWGAGRPGWHIECSAMAERYLGSEFDVHGGGLDLRFPHHENELAQSTSAGSPFARLWVHNGLVTVAGQKMSKSLGNSVFAADLLGAARPVVVRYALEAAHYRSDLDHSAGSLVEAEEAVARIERFVERAVDAGAPPAPAIVPPAFAAAMDDDLGVPQALAVLHDTIRRGNQAIDAGELQAAGEALGAVRAMVGVLGIDPADPAWSAGVQDDGSREALGALVERLIEERQEARRARDFAAADRVRDELAAAGIALTDTGDGTRWSIDGR